MADFQNKILFALVLAVLITAGVLFIKSENLDKQSTTPRLTEASENDPLFQKFQILSSQGNSACSQDFRDSISSMPDGQRLQGSCCSQMIFHRYKEQVEGLKKYGNIPQIPPDPYDIPAGLAKELLAYGREIILTSDEQKQYDLAMETSDEKGPCCCKCWRWYVYEGLGKFLIRNHKFSGSQVADIWNLSDGCGGDRHVPDAHSV